MQEQEYLRRAGFAGLIPLVAMIVMFAMGRFPYPDNNHDGREYLSYMLPHRGAEIQAILALVINGAALLFILLLALSYRERAGRVTPAGMVMISGMTIYTAASLVSAGLYLTIVQLGRGYASFGESAEDLKLIAFAWGAANTILGIAGPVLAMVWAAIVRANQAFPLLPRVLGVWCAAAVAVVATVVALVSLFIDSGPWGPGSSYSTGLILGSTFVWILATSIVLLRAKPPAAT
jgi:hypothetical protein